MVQRIIGGKTGAAAKAAAAPAVTRVTVDEGSEGQRLDNFLIKLLKGVPKTHVYRVIRSGEVRVNKGRAAADTRLAIGDEVRDIEAARAAGIACGAATWGYSATDALIAMKPELVFESMNDIAARLAA